MLNFIVVLQSTNPATKLEKSSWNLFLATQLPWLIMVQKKGVNLGTNAVFGFTFHLVNLHDVKWHWKFGTAWVENRKEGHIVRNS